MQRSTQEKLFHEINGYYRTNSTKLSSTDTRHEASIYFSPERLEEERRVLKTHPQIVGHSTQLSEPGDFISHDYAGAPLLICRQADNSLKAFLNICTHRGAPVCAHASGNRSRFTCPYHGWTFKNDGSLMSAPKDGFPNLDQSTKGLAELAVEERHGLIWAILTPGKKIDIASYLGPVDAELASYGLSEYVPEREELLTPEINWKCTLDGFLEVYHFAALHGESLGPYFNGKYSPYDEFGIHGRLVGIRKSYDEIVDKPFDDVDFLTNVAVNYQIFPNTIIVWQGDHFEVWTSYPGKTPGTSTAHLFLLTTKEMNKSEFKPRWDRNWRVILSAVSDEDWAIQHKVQQLLPFIPDNEIVFGAIEPGLQHYHLTMDAAIETQS